MKPPLALLLSLTCFLGSFLLFSAEPMIGKMVLPRWGGTPSVWITCLLYFQIILLCGYLLSGGLTRAQAAAGRHMPWMTISALVALVTLSNALLPFDFPISGVIDPSPRVNDSPTSTLLMILLGRTSVPFIVLSLTSPVVQHWLSRTDHPQANDPYFLYAAGNVGSLTGLLAYPFLIEPYASLHTQASAWKYGFLAFGILLLSSATIAYSRLRQSPAQGTDTSDGANTRGDDESASFPSSRALRCLFLVALPSSWLMGVTTYLTTDLAAMPLLWVVPLALYLLSFIIAFASRTRRIVHIATSAFPYVVIPWTLVVSAGFAHAAWIPLHLVVFFTGAIACHGALATMRPAASHLSTFYIIIAIGGLIGGAFNSLLAPVLFDRIIEYPLAVVLACTIPAWAIERAGQGDSTIRQRLKSALIPLVVLPLTALLATNQSGLADSPLGIGALMIASGLAFLACVTAHRHPVRFASTVAAVIVACGLAPGPSGQLIHIERNFFGVLRVTLDPEDNVHRLFHGSTLHGEQSLDPAHRLEPSTYFTRSGPVGQIFTQPATKSSNPSGSEVAIVGLGAGTLACYAKPGERWSFYEIDPAVERIARDSRYFNYLADCRADAIEVLIGDARLRLREAPPHAYRLIMLDAFSSDSLPVHLISREAIQLYLSKLAPGGMLAFNLSNRYLDLDPLIGRQARDAGLFCRIRYDLDLSIADLQAGKQPSIWAVMAEDANTLAPLSIDPRWLEPLSRPGSSAWTDDYSDLASYLLLAPRHRRTPAAPAGDANAIEGKRSNSR